MEIINTVTQQTFSVKIHLKTGKRKIENVLKSLLSVGDLQKQTTEPQLPTNWIQDNVKKES